MRILFDSDLAHGQAMAVWRCREILETKYGIELVQHQVPAPFEVDLVLTHTVSDDWQAWIEENKYQIPVVALERIDGAQLSAAVRQHIDNPNLRAVIKNTIYADPNRYNQGSWRGHELECRVSMGENPEVIPDRKQITPADYAKLKLGFSFAAYPHYDPLNYLEPFDLTADRPYTCHFAGTVEYEGDLPWLNWHRRCAVDAIRNCPGNHIVYDNRAMQRDPYFQSLRQAELVVSPWGLGEPCYRDFEAILSGCMVIKPDTQYIATVPNVFYQIPPIQRFICKPDFSDLAEIVENAQRVPIGDRIQWAKWLAEMNAPAANAKRLAAIFKEALK